MLYIICFVTAIQDPDHSRDISTSPRGDEQPEVQATVRKNLVLPPLTKKRRLMKQHTTAAKKKAVGPIYLCGVCHLICEYQTNLESESDNSVGCEKCQIWFHWGCVGFDGDQSDDDWYCQKCIEMIKQE